MLQKKNVVYSLCCRHPPAHRQRHTAHSQRHGGAGRAERRQRAHRQAAPLARAAVTDEHTFSSTVYCSSHCPFKKFIRIN